MLTAMEFSELRYGMFIHFGLFSQLGRGEWVMNREQIGPEKMKQLAAGFNPVNFNADALCDLAVAGGMKYLVFTTMHHDGFRLYDTKLTDHNAKKAFGRDLVREIADAAHRHGLKLGLYHSLNNWLDEPDAVAAQENSDDYNKFIEHTFARLKELVTLFKPFDIMWYDGSWPFNAQQWQAKRMNAELRAIQPDLLFNDRNGLPGDFGTPENHITAPNPWRPWEACMTLNEHWGYHRHDRNWKSPIEVVQMLVKCSIGKGNLLLNIGPDGTGAVPAESSQIVRTVGDWIRNGGDDILRGVDAMPYAYGLRQPGDCGDWDAAGPFLRKDNTLYQIMFYQPAGRHVLTGLECKVLSVSAAQFGALPFTQDGGRLEITLPEGFDEAFAPVLKMECDRAPVIYRTGGMRVPKCPHPRYDPVEPDIDYDK